MNSIDSAVVLLTPEGISSGNGLFFQILWNMSFCTHLEFLCPCWHYQMQLAQWDLMRMNLTNNDVYITCLI